MGLVALRPVFTGGTPLLSYAFDGLRLSCTVGGRSLHWILLLAISALLVGTVVVATLAAVVFLLWTVGCEVSNLLAIVALACLGAVVVVILVLACSAAPVNVCVSLLCVTLSVVLSHSQCV